MKGHILTCPPKMGTTPWVVVIRYGDE